MGPQRTVKGEVPPVTQAVLPATPGGADSLPVRAPVGTRIVGLGASAGGLAALEQFLAQVPASSGLAYVVVQHLDPTHGTMLSELLQRVTAMPVREAVQGQRVAPDSVYVIPPNQELTVQGGALQLGPAAKPRGQRLAIDLLFSSLARDQGERAIGVVLSGMGADGSVGLQAIKSQGGLTLVQAPQSAAFDAMPKNALATGCVDITDEAGALPARILQVTAERHAALLRPEGSDSSDAAALASILEQLRRRSHHDLSEYKPSTLHRRILRRMGVHGLTTRAAYEGFVRQNPGELDLLFNEMLIGVTSFFRDPGVWQELRDDVLPALLARTAEGTRLRAWVVGCSTGEEAYTLAMVFQEAADALPGGGKRSLQVFATDLSADAIAVARRGFYPKRIAADVGTERLARFFAPHGTGYIIDKQLRERVLFAQHDVIQDPPFTRLDLLCCRNLMIYFTAPLQRRLLPLFSFSLRPGGVLVLGTAETMGRTQSGFTPVSAKSRIYSRSEMGGSARAVEFPVKPPLHTRKPHQESHVITAPASPTANLQALAERALLQAFAPPAVLVNDVGDVIYVHGAVGRFLEPAAGKANWNIHVMARPAIRTQITGALRHVLQDAQPVELPGLPLDEGHGQTVHVSVHALQAPQALVGLVMIAFRAGPEGAGKPRRRRRSPGSPDPVLAEELQRLRDEVQALGREMGSSAEELQAANEELQSTNEELQSANEELTTSKEESQSMNEELQTLNGELQSKLDDLALAQSDMQNLLNSTDIATLFLDNDLNVRRYTEQMPRIIHLREGDVGRPLTDLASTLVYPQLDEDARQTLRTLSTTEKEITTTDGLWFLVRIKPYRTLANTIQGLVITFIDITAAKALEARLRAT
ncbi:MAG: chemotaxis protein CheB [Rubrivivax sp.]|nr:chemotaxis protein CheB [Rubrivivax sp.]